jgi:hypothetical protein
MPTAACSCGQLKAHCDGEPVRISVCHCLECQKRTGSVFGVQARWPADRVTFEGRAQEWARVGDEGSRATFRFCPTCGAMVYWTSDALPAFVIVAVGAFADPSFPAPRVSVYGVRRHAWVTLPSSVEELE